VSIPCVLVVVKSAAVVSILCDVVSWWITNYNNTRC
jgi:hypothetical protein